MGDANVLKRILDGAEDPTNLSLQLLKDITGNFSEERKIGQGGFGEVYKGVLGNKIVAVKRIDVNVYTVDDKSFLSEINSLKKINHQNVVRFLGFCSNTHRTFIKDANLGDKILVSVNERLLCLEYISKGSLDKHITDELRGLEWKTRYEIIMGICNGLCYLHKEKDIVHMDLKPMNIFLDDHMIPKIADFGLSRPNQKTHTMALPIGTIGYIAPEYRENKETSPACDIYSLGAIIMELVTGGKEVPNKHNVLRRWRHRWNKPPTRQQYQQVTRCIDIAGGCRRQEPKDRPSICDIIRILSEPERMDGHIGQEIITYLDDDMLGIEPLKLHFNKEMSWSVKLSNKTKTCSFFDIEGPRKQYTVEPDKGIVPPGFENRVQITVHPQQVSQNGDNFIVRSTKEESGEVVDEVALRVLYEPASPKAINSSSYEDGTRGKLDHSNFHPPENFSSNQATNMTYLLRASDRAMDVTRGAMGSLLHKLGVLDKEFNLKGSIEKDAEQLVKMQQVLHKVSALQQDNLDGLVKRWASNAREMSYDLEDFVDGFLVHSEPDSNGSLRELTHEMYLEKGKSHQPIGDLIKHHISERVQDAAAKCEERKVDNIVANATTIVDTEDPRIFSRYIESKQLIGIEVQKKKLISLLEEELDKSMLKIVSIFGLGGLGKTRLAQAVSEELNGYHPKAFVPVGRNPDVKEVLKDIIYEIDNNFNAANLNVRKLLNKVYELLTNKRYFIVINDIWDSSKWNGIRGAFPEDENGSRLVITTRDRRVALACCNSESKYVYEIKRLGDEDSRRLFLRGTFGRGNDCADTPRKEEISKYILKRCGGMPLAINSIASLLAGQEDTSWENIRKSLGGLTEGNDLGNMKRILDLSYIHLPGDLKTCLHHVCMYPEDYEIDKADLLRQWVAEGFVCAEGQLDAEEVAENNFKALISMCMIEPGKRDYNDEVLSCRVHDIILDLMRSKSSGMNFGHVIDGLKALSGPSGEIRRASVQKNDKGDGEITIKGSLSHARSVLLYRRLLLPDFLKYKYVRVLHLEDKRFSKELVDLTGICNLFLLRYLKISCHSLSIGALKLPDQIGQLQQLETIYLKGGKLKNYPPDIVTLPRLSNLNYSGHLGIILPHGIERLKCLRTLEGVTVLQSSIETINGLGKLTRLKNLGITSSFISRKLEEVEISARMNALHSSISRLSTSLRILSLEAGLTRRHDMSYWSKKLFPEGSRIGKLHLSECTFQRCPEWIGQLHYLYSLSIVVREVADGVSITARLPSLAYFRLEIDYYEKEEKEESVVISGFQALRILCFYCKRASLTFEEGALPKLEKLDILFPFNIIRRTLPVGLQHLPAATLKQICLRMTDHRENDADWKVKGSEHWKDREWDIYFDTAQYQDRLREHKRKSRTMLKRAFKSHHPRADIIIHIQSYDVYDSDPKGVDDEEDNCPDKKDDEDNHEDSVDESDKYAYDDADFCKEDYCITEKDDESVDDEEAGKGAYQVNGSQTSAQVQANTGKYEVNEAQEDSGGLSINTDAPPTSLHLAVALHGHTDDVGSLQPPFTSLANRAVCSSPGRAEPVANFLVDINNDRLVQHGNNGMLVSSVGPNFDLSQAPPGGLEGVAAADVAAQPQDEVVDDDSSDKTFWDNLMMDLDEGAEDNDDDDRRMGADDNEHEVTFWENLQVD